MGQELRRFSYDTDSCEPDSFDLFWRHRMTEFPAIPTRVCADTIGRMKQARKQKNEADFDLEKNRLLDVLAILEIADFIVYTKYSKYSEMTFDSKDNDLI